MRPTFSYKIKIFDYYILGPNLSFPYNLYLRVNIVRNNMESWSLFFLIYFKLNCLKIKLIYFGKTHYNGSMSYTFKFGHCSIKQSIVVYLQFYSHLKNIQSIKLIKTSTRLVLVFYPKNSPISNNIYTKKM